jgi:hypothetical protein
MKYHVTGNFSGKIERNQDYQKIPSHDGFIPIVDIDVDMSVVYIRQASDGFDVISGVSRG